MRLFFLLCISATLFVFIHSVICCSGFYHYCYSLSLLKLIQIHLFTETKVHFVLKTSTSGLVILVIAPHPNFVLHCIRHLATSPQLTHWMMKLHVEMLCLQSSPNPIQIFTLHFFSSPPFHHRACSSDRTAQSREMVWKEWLS